MYRNDHLSAFAKATRHNGMNLPMRTVAQLLMQSERQLLALYYAKEPRGGMIPIRPLNEGEITGHGIL
jgi:cytochrome c553